MTTQDSSLQTGLFQHVLDSVADFLLVIGTDFRVKLMNRAAREFHAVSGGDPERPAYCYQLFFGLDRPCDGQGYDCPLIRVLESGQQVRVEQERQMAGHGLRTFELIASPLLGDDGNLLGIVESLRDITERKRAATLLQDHHDRLERLVQIRTQELLCAKEDAEMLYKVCPTAVFTVDAQCRTMSWNNKAAELSGYSSNELLGNSCHELFVFDESSDCCARSEGGPPELEGMECRLRTKYGEERLISLNIKKLISHTGVTKGMIGSFKDITRQKLIEAQIRGERDKFKSMLTSMDQGMHIVNQQYTIEFQNDVLQVIFGDQIGRKCYEVYRQRSTPCDSCRMHRAIENHALERVGEIILQGRSYHQCYAPFTDSDGAPKVLVVLRDITEEKQLQADTMRAAQLASIGELAAGVAHEINNPVNGIINYAQLLLDELHDPAQKDMLQRVIQEGERVAGIVRNLLAFSRQHDEEVAHVDVRAVLDDALALIGHQLRKDCIILKKCTPTPLPVVYVNAKHLQQVFLNLLSNARHALNVRHVGCNPGKVLQLACQTTLFRGRPYVEVQISDGGTGIAASTIDQIFEPFFTTKKSGEGTGLGLSVSKKIIESFDGYIFVESIFGEGTTFSVLLPADTAPAVEHAGDADTAPARSAT
ncbi:MAG: hypothetical protein BWK76_00535 [Desulfobulbaceae bacterium A2]|nr:MAG: hypothetical protein BWK76_00535 [Desulfobulbaceae bacterium A2]